MLVTNLLALGLGAFPGIWLCSHSVGAEAVWLGLGSIGEHRIALRDSTSAGQEILAYVCCLGRCLCARHGADPGLASTPVRGRCAEPRSDVGCSPSGVFVLVVAGGATVRVAHRDRTRSSRQRPGTHTFGTQLMGISGVGGKGPELRPAVRRDRRRRFGPGARRSDRSSREYPGLALDRSRIPVPLALRSRLPLAWGALPFIALAIVLSVEVLRDPFNLSRALAPVFTAAPFLLVLARRDAPAPQGDATPERA